MIDLNKLKAAAEAAKAYQPDAIKAHSFGCFDEEGVFYELGNVCARIYERDENSDGSSADDALLNHIIAASPDAVLELIAMASAAAPQVVADELAAFEVHITDNGAWPRAAERSAGGEYRLMASAVAWNTWRAATDSFASRAAGAVQVQPVAVPDGWKLVPRELSEDHLREVMGNINRKYKGNPLGEDLTRLVWQWAIHASPAAPAAQGDKK